MNLLPAIDRRTLRSYVDDLYNCSEARQDLLDNYSAIRDQLRAQELRGDLLERQLHDVRDFTGPIRQYVNQHYNNLRATLENAEQKVAEFQEELADPKGCLQEIPILKSSPLNITAARHAHQEKHQRQMALLKKS